MINLHDLCLDDARALLGHHPASRLPEPQESHTAYLQCVINNLCDLSLKDPLTGLANRRHFRNVLDREIHVVARSGVSALLLMVDIDHFKKVNDTHGHLVGDRVIHAVADCLSACVRPVDTVARYGGEEFAVILPNCQDAFGPIVAERIRMAVGALSIQVAPQVHIQVNISIGGAYAPEWIQSTAALWTERADVELYRAKAEGRNRVCIGEHPLIAVSAEEKNMLFGHLSLTDSPCLETASQDAAGRMTDSATTRVN